MLTYAALRRSAAAPREIEALLNWSFGDQMAHCGGASAASFTGYSHTGVADSSSMAGGGGLVPLRPQVHPYAEAVNRALSEGLDRRGADKLVLYAARRSRPGRGDDRVWFDRPGPEDINPATGKRLADYRYDGFRGYCMTQHKMVDNRVKVACNVVQRGPSPDAQARARAEYRLWFGALVQAYESLKRMGFDVEPPVARPLPIEPWEGWKPRYAKASDKVDYTSKK